MGYSVLRVINDDRVDGGAGFATHPHRNMEIVSYVLDGAMEHRDSMGFGGVIRPGDVQRMSAGTGVAHSEFNASETEPLHFLQIWIMPERNGLSPSYEQKHFSETERRGQLRLIVSPDGSDGSVTIHQDARLYATLLSAEEQVSLPINHDRKIYMHVARGSVQLDGKALHEGDGAYIEQQEVLEMKGIKNGEVLVFDLPG
jgi:redox-sensitive bicupin YhaK (pirin superfamily)